MRDPLHVVCAGLACAASCVAWGVLADPVLWLQVGFVLALALAYQAGSSYDGIALFVPHELGALLVLLAFFLGVATWPAGAAAVLALGLAIVAAGYFGSVV